MMFAQYFIFYCYYFDALLSRVKRIRILSKYILRYLIYVPMVFKVSLISQYIFCSYGFSLQYCFVFLVYMYPQLKPRHCKSKLQDTAVDFARILEISREIRNSILLVAKK